MLKMIKARNEKLLERYRAKMLKKAKKLKKQGKIGTAEKERWRRAL